MNSRVSVHRREDGDGGGQVHDALSLAEEQRVGRQDEGVGARPRHGFERTFKIARLAHVRHGELHPHLLGRCFGSM